MRTEVSLYWKDDGKAKTAKAYVEYPRERQIPPAVIKCYAGGTTRTFARSNWSSDYHATEAVRAYYIRGSEREL